MIWHGIMSWDRQESVHHYDLLPVINGVHDT